MDVEELLASLEHEPGPDLEHRLVSYVQRLREDTLIDPVEDEIAELRNQINELKTANDRLEQTVTELRDRMAHDTPVPIDHTYSIEQFMHALATKRGRTYAWRTDYASATQITPGCQLVKTDDIQRWQKERRVPDWAFDQIDVLDYRPRLGRTVQEWAPDEVQHLIDLYHVNPNESNASLAAKCTIQFGREISEDAIKGALYRLGQQGRLPLHRTAR